MNTNAMILNDELTLQEKGMLIVFMMFMKTSSDRKNGICKDDSVAVANDDKKESGFNEDNLLVHNIALSFLLQGHQFLHVIQNCKNVLFS